MTIKDLNKALGIMHTVYHYEDEYTEINIESDLRPGEKSIVKIRTYDLERA